jgi:hypothetical protein
VYCCSVRLQESRSTRSNAKFDGVAFPCELRRLGPDFYKPFVLSHNAPYALFVYVIRPRMTHIQKSRKYPDETLYCLMSLIQGEAHLASFSYDLSGKSALQHNGWRILKHSYWSPKSSTRLTTKRRDKLAVAALVLTISTYPLTTVPPLGCKVCPAM